MFIEACYNFNFYFRDNQADKTCRNHRGMDRKYYSDFKDLKQIFIWWHNLFKNTTLLNVVEIGWKANIGKASTCCTEIRRKTKREEREVAMLAVLADGGGGGGVVANQRWAQARKG